MNISILTGRLTKDPELKSTQGGLSVCSFTIAVDRKFKKQGEPKQTDFINIVVWRHTADFIVKHFVKGQMISITGSIQTRTWDDTDGKRHYATEVVASDAEFVGSKQDNGGGTGSTEGTSNEHEGFKPVDTDEDLPF